MSQSTYSFLDTIIVFAHPDLAIPITVTGEGAGSISVSMTDNRTSMDTAADGSIMISKIAGNSGSVSINVQQTSLVHKKLLALYNLLILAAPSSWATAAMTIKNITDGTGHLCTGVTFQKVPDKSYQKEGQHITWTLLCADVQSLTV
ncbi:DUF3277 family protein [bacterium]|nr:DUF3277 family protein [bacterium]